MGAVVFSMLGGLWSTLQRVFKWLGTLDLRTLVALLCALVAGVAWLSRNNMRSERDDALDGVKRMTTVLVTSERRIRDANARAIANATDAKNKAEKKYAKLEQKANDDQEALVRNYRARVDVYARRMRATQANQRDTSAADLPFTPTNPESPIGSGRDAIIVSRTDLDILVANTARLKIAHDWAQGLQNIGQEQ